MRSLNAPVVIIGAGTAGLTAARELARRGLPAILLEARNRIGGRVWTNFDFAPLPVEFGGEWIHGDHAPT
jgi:monoamine oxidase